MSAAFGHLTSIMNGKSWVRAMRAFRMVTAVLLQHYIEDTPKTFEEISTYLEQVRQHPTGQHWVDNFIKPTLLAHQFLRAEREGNWLFQQLCIERMLPYFFSAGHIHYARYLAWHLLEMRNLPENVKSDLMAGAHVCRHIEGTWNSVSSDQFGEQTAIKKGKGGMTGMTLSPDLVAEWIDSFPVFAYLSDAMELVYAQPTSIHPPQVKHKEEGKRRCQFDVDDRKLLEEELSKHSHPLTVNSPSLYNIVNGQVASDNINVNKALVIGKKMAVSFQQSLPNGFHSKISTPVKTMELLKQGVKVGSKIVYDLEGIFLRLLMVGKQRDIQLETIFSYELSAVPTSIIDEYGCLRKGNKSNLANRLAVIEKNPLQPCIVIVDVQQLLYHICWPHGGDASCLVNNIQQHMEKYPSKCEKILVFDKYEDNSAKDHERMRRAGEGSTKYNLTVNAPLPARESVMRNKHNKRSLSKVLASFDMGNNVTVECQDDGGFGHEEADVTMVAYMLQVAEYSKVVRILSDDTDVFVLLVYWVWKAQLYTSCRVQMENWNGRILDINATCIQLGSKCLQLLGLHALTGCDTVSYPFSKGKVGALKILQTADFPDLSDKLGEEETSKEELLVIGQTVFDALYNQLPGTKMSQARYNLYTRKKGKPLRIMALPPTDENLLLHVQRAHLQMILWKSADKQRPPMLDIRQYGWTSKDGIPSPSISSNPPAPPGLTDILSCGCKSQGNACSSSSCSCHKNHLSCTVYCKCASSGDCKNPFHVADYTSDDEGDNE